MHRPTAGDDQPLAVPDPATAALVGLLPELGDADAQLDILKGIRAGIAGKRQIAPPSNWAAVYREHLAKSDHPEVRHIAQLVAIQFGDAEVRQELLQLTRDEQAPLDRRREALSALAEIRAAGLTDELHKLLAGSALRRDALRTLAEFSGRETPAEVIRAYPNLDLEEKRIAIDVLSSGREAAQELLRAVEAAQIPRTDLNAETIRRLKLLRDDTIDAAIAEHWGAIRETPEAKAEQIAALKELLTRPVDREPDLPRGRAIFAKTCRQCHTLYGDGEKVGPDITGTNRADLDYLLVNVVDPNATVGKDYQAWSVLTEAGKLHVGLLVGEDDQNLTLRTETDTIHIPLGEIEYRELTPVSMMPEGLFDQLPEDDLRDLVAYLRSSRQVPLLATRQTAALFFNRQDLSQWRAVSGHWHVADGQLHGTPADLDTGARTGAQTNGGTATGGQVGNESVLVSELLLDEFVLEMEARLSAERGSGGVMLLPLSSDKDDALDQSRPAALVIELDTEGVASLTQMLLHGEADTRPQQSASGWHAIRIARSADAFTVDVQGQRVATAEGDAIPRVQVALVVEGIAEARFTVRGLRLHVPADAPAGGILEERAAR